MTTNNHESAGRNVKYAQHISALCRAFKVRLVISKRMAPHDAGAGLAPDRPGKKVIMIAPVIDETTYAVALHELGHCLSAFGMLHDQGSKTLRLTNKLTTFRDIRLLIVSEEAAWEWAHHYALEWTPLMQSIEDMSINRYRAQARHFGAIK